MKKMRHTLLITLILLFSINTWAATAHASVSQRLSLRLVKDGGQTIATEVSKLILEAVYPTQKITLWMWGEIKEVSSAKIVDVSDNFISSVGAAAEKNELAPAFYAFLTTMAFEVITPWQVKIVIGSGKVVVGTVSYEVDVLEENYRDALSQRFLIGRGPLLETYKNYLRGMTPFQEWGLAKERHLYPDFSNLYQIFPHEAGLKAQWDRYARFVVSSVGLRDVNLAITQTDLANAYRNLQSIWQSQRNEQMALAAAEYARSQKEAIDRRIADELFWFSQAAEVIRGIALQEHMLVGRLRGADGAGLGGEELYIKIGGPEYPAAQAIRIQGIRVGYDGSFQVPVKGIKPGMVSALFAVGRAPDWDAGIRSGLFSYRSSPVSLPELSEIFDAFDHGEWDRVRPVSGPLRFDVVLARTDNLPEPTALPPADPAEARSIAFGVNKNPTTSTTYTHRLAVMNAYFQTLKAQDREALFGTSDFAKVVKTLDGVRKESGATAAQQTLDRLYKRLTLTFH